MPANPWFVRQLKLALASLYDPSVLRASPLADLLNPTPHGDRVASLRRTLLDSIEFLRPSRNIPPDSRTWRVYQILRRRYSEGLGQRRVAADLGLSIRQLQREEKAAREMLADHLWVVCDLETKVPQDAAGEFDEEPEASDETPPHSVQEELTWLRNSVPVQLTDVGELIQEVLATVEPLLGTAKVKLAYQPAKGGRVPLRAAILRQALLDLTSVAVTYALGGQLHMQTELLPQQLSIRMQALGGRASQVPETAPSESLAMARELVRLCDGSLQITTAASAGTDQAAAFGAAITIPLPEQVPVLVVDDNADALQLLQRYLATSRYLFIGTQEAQRGVELAVEFCPQVIVLDVMMPEKDGWSVLGQLREHPETRAIPVVVCTILSQRELALALGAAAFMRKPVNRSDLLATLDRLVAQASVVR